MEEFGSLLWPSLTIFPSHVKRDANIVADCLENEGVATMTEMIHLNAQTSPRFELSYRCQDLARLDYLIPNGVPRSIGSSQTINLIMGACLNCLSRAEGCLPRMTGVMERKIKDSGAITTVVMSLLLDIIQQCTNLHHFSLDLHLTSRLVLWCTHYRNLCKLAIHITFSM